MLIGCGLDFGQGWYVSVMFEVVLSLCVLMLVVSGENESEILNLLRSRSAEGDKP